MTPRQRVLAALNGDDVDRPPVSNPTSVATVELMDYVDAPFPDACRDANLNAQLAITGYTELGFDSKKMIKIDDLSKVAIDSLMTPGMRVLVARKGKIVYDKNFGYHTYEKKRHVMKNDIYDLASLTKIMATLPLVIKSFSKGEINFETTISDLLPDWKNTNKSDINLKNMLSSGLRSLSE